MDIYDYICTYAKIFTKLKLYLTIVHSMPLFIVNRKQKTHEKSNNDCNCYGTRIRASCTID